MQADSVCKSAVSALAAIPVTAAVMDSVTNPITATDIRPVTRCIPMATRDRMPSRWDTQDTTGVTVTMAAAITITTIITDTTVVVARGKSNSAEFGDQSTASCNCKPVSSISKRRTESSHALPRCLAMYNPRCIFMPSRILPM